MKISLNVSIDSETVNVIDAIARKQKRPRSSIIQEIFDRYISKIEDDWRVEEHEKDELLKNEVKI